MIRLRPTGLPPWLDSIVRTTLKYPDVPDGVEAAVIVELRGDPRHGMDENAPSQRVDGTTIRTTAFVPSLVTADSMDGRHVGDRTEAVRPVRATVNRWLADISRHIAEICARKSLPLLRVAPWPSGRRFAACLTHDVDQVYDRELFRILADLNHLRRVWFAGEPGRSSACVRRIARSLVVPKNPIEQFRSIRRLERRYGWPSTFFFLRDRYWARFGARYRLQDRSLRRIAAELIAEGCELGIHGSYYHHDDVAWLRDSIHELERSLDCEVAGVRNHQLRLAIPTTWEAQYEAGLEYDATFGDNAIPGPRAGIALPFFPSRRGGDDTEGLLEIPLTIMDGTLFRSLALDAAGALELARAIVTDASDHEGLVTLLWHNNYFDESEYIEWSDVFAALLEDLARRRAAVMTARGVNDWWRARARVELRSAGWGPGWWSGHLRTDLEIDDVALELEGSDPGAELEIGGGDASVERGVPTKLHFRHLDAGQQLTIRVGRPSESPE